MRIHRIEVEAFGPFAERVVLDLDEASSSGLFLVHGPTGSGKTSLLDAICFALYADVPGSRRRQGLRSDHVGPDAVPEVVVETTVGGRRLRFTRSPEWQRPKKRGAGTTKQQARVVLEELRGGSWVSLSTRHDEVAEVVTDVVGMGMEQFKTVVLLPQGDFATFLRATPEDRRAVLERLFDITEYADLEAWLAGARRESTTAVERARGALDADLAVLDDALAAVAGPPLLGTAGEDSGDGEAQPLAETPTDLLAARVSGLTDALDARISDAMTRLDRAESVESAARLAVGAATETAGRRARGLTARERLAELDGLAQAQRERVHRLEAAERAAGVQGHLVAVDREQEHLDQCLARAGEVAEVVRGSGVDLGGDTAGTLVERVRARDGAAERVRSARADVVRVRDALVALEEERAGAMTALEETTDEAEREREQLVEAEAEVERLAELAARTGECSARVAALRGVLHALEENDRDRALLGRLAPEVQDARELALERREHLVGLRARRLDAMAAELADGLVDGAGCPVCGSAEHPSPATHGDRVDDEQLAAAERDVETAEAQYGELRTRAAGLEAAIRTRLGGLPRIEGLSAEPEEAAVALALEAASADLDRARTATSGLAEARRRVGTLRSAAERRTAARERAAATLDGLRERSVALEDDAAEAARALTAAVDEHADCPCATEDAGGHQRCERDLSALTQAEDRADTARDRCQAALADLEVALEEANVESAEACRRALLTQADTDRLRDAVQAHERAREAACAVLAEPEVRTALEQEAPEVSLHEEALRDARRDVLAASDELAALRRSATTVGRLGPRVVEACEELVRLVDREARLRELADTVGGTGGDNTLRMRLTSFVLAARLETVASRANERLAVMGGGRYLLEHSDARAARGARSGLGLRVLDQWTGQVRDTASLSGGESFMASLALALGLADAVREEAGGLDLGTLFIDEGFGSLDDDSLDQVLTVLDGLREGGRAVGVVSHVADLRARIPHQVVVTKSASGSTAAVRVAEGAPAA